jgi:predicted AAA+ superfamily ATPase
VPDAERRASNRACLDKNKIRSYVHFGIEIAEMEAKMATIPRFLEDPGGHHFLFGPRGTGKSTWLGVVHPEALFIDLLAPDLERRYAARPERLRELVVGNPETEVLVVDEVQKVPQLLDVVHQIMETTPKPRFILTGSSARKLKRAGVDLLAGRAILRSMHPFMAAELGETFDLELALRQGLLPLVWDSDHPDETLRAYVSLYLREEVQAEGMVRNIGSFSRFLEAISFSHASVLNTSEVARECEVSRKTVEGYIEILGDLLLSFRLPVFTKRARRHLTSHPKFYWFDAGVFRSVRPAGPLDRPEEIAGTALEGLVAQHLRAWIDYTDPAFTLGFWRTKSGNEVDFVVYGPNGFWGIEVKHSSSVRAKDLRGLKAFVSDYPEAMVRLLYRGSERLEIDGIPCLPCDDFLKRVVPGADLP